MSKPSLTPEQWEQMNQITGVTVPYPKEWAAQSTAAPTPERKPTFKELVHAGRTSITPEQWAAAESSLVLPSSLTFEDVVRMDQISGLNRSGLFPYVLPERKPGSAEKKPTAAAWNGGADDSIDVPVKYRPRFVGTGEFERDTPFALGNGRTTDERLLSTPEAQDLTASGYSTDEALIEGTRQMLHPERNMLGALPNRNYRVPEIDPTVSYDKQRPIVTLGGEVLTGEEPGIEQRIEARMGQERERAGQMAREEQERRALIEKKEATQEQRRQHRQDVLSKVDEGAKRQNLLFQGWANYGKGQMLRSPDLLEGDAAHAAIHAQRQLDLLDKKTKQDKAEGDTSSGLLGALFNSSTFQDVFGWSKNFEKRLLNRALDKSERGEPLTPAEKDIIEIHRLGLEVQKSIEARGGLTTGAQIGKNIGESLPFLRDFAMTGGLGGAAGKAAVGALVRTAGGKYLKKAAQKGLEYAISSAVMTPLQSGTYENYLDRTIDQYRFAEDGSIEKFATPAFARTYKALAESFNEVFSEHIGGELGKAVGWMLRAPARKISKVLGHEIAFDMTFGGYKRNFFIDFLRNRLGWQGTFQEFFEEVYTGITTPLFTGEPERMKDFWVGGNWWKTFLTVGTMGAGFMVLDTPAAVGYGAQIHKYRRIERNSLASIDNLELRGMIYNASHKPTLWEQSEALSKIDWKNFNLSLKDASHIADYLFARAAKNIFKETGRAMDATGQFYKELEKNVHSRLYCGVDGTQPTRQIVLCETNEGGPYAVLSGDYEGKGPDNMLIVSDAEGEKKTIPLSSVKSFETRNADDYLSMRFAEITGSKQSSQQLEDAEEEASIASEAGIDPQQAASVIAQDIGAYEPGEEAQLTDGREVVVSQRLADGYMVQDEEGSSYIIAPEDIAYDKADMAEETLRIDRFQPQEEATDTTESEESEAPGESTAEGLSGPGVQVPAAERVAGDTPVFAEGVVDDGPETLPENIPMEAGPQGEGLDISAGPQEAGIDTESEPQTGTPLPGGEPQSSGTQWEELPEVPTTKDGTPDFTRMSPIMLGNQVEKLLGSRARAYEALRGMFEENNRQLEKLQAKVPTKSEAFNDYAKKIAGLRREAERLGLAMERYSDLAAPVPQAGEDASGGVSEFSGPENVASPDALPEVTLSGQEPAGKYLPESAIRPQSTTKSTRSAQLEGLGDYVSIDDVILRDIASGSVKFIWKDQGVRRGLSTELGFADRPGEQQARLGLLNSKEGVTPEEYAEHLYHTYGRGNEGGTGVSWNLDDTEIKNRVLDILTTVTNLEIAFKQAVELHKEYNPYEGWDEEDFAEQDADDRRKRELENENRERRSQKEFLEGLSHTVPVAEEPYTPASTESEEYERKFIPLEHGREEQRAAYSTGEEGELYDDAFVDYHAGAPVQYDGSVYEDSIHSLGRERGVVPDRNSGIAEEEVGVYGDSFRGGMGYVYPGTEAEGVDTAGQGPVSYSEETVRPGIHDNDEGFGPETEHTAEGSVGVKKGSFGERTVGSNGTGNGSVPGRFQEHNEQGDGDYRQEVAERAEQTTPDAMFREADEREEILDRALQNGTWLKAPNGAPTNLTPGQWVTVRTRSFKEWFGDWENSPERASKVIDENGEPMVVYHGTDDSFYEFKYSEIRKQEGSFFFAQNLEDAKSYSGTGSVIEVFVNLRRPADYENLPNHLNSLGEDKRFQVEELKKLGYDGWMCDMDAGWGEISAFYPSQIKSATGNAGAFDASNPDIRFRESEDSRTVNFRFNEELDRQIAGELPEGHIYRLGRPSEALLSAGIPDLPIELSAERLEAKASVEYEGKHPFALESIRNLPDALSRPIAVFDARKKNGGKVVLTELHEGGSNFVVAMQVRKSDDVRKIEVEVNDIRSLYPKDRKNGIIAWINGGLLRWTDKKKASDYISTQWPNYIGGGNTTESPESFVSVAGLGKRRSHSADVAIPDNGDMDAGAADNKLSSESNEVSAEAARGQETSGSVSTQWPDYIAGGNTTESLISATKIIQNFENPSVGEGKIVSAAETLATELNTPLEFVREVGEISDRDGLRQKRKRRSKGWYEPSTGKVVIVIPNHTGVSDVQATVLHEVVGHKGLRGALGDRFEGFLDKVYASLESAEKESIDRTVSERDGADPQARRTATEEYLAGLAERDVNPGVFARIMGRVREILREILHLPLRVSDADIVYMLWKSKRRLQRGADAMQVVEHLVRDRELREKLQAGEDAVFRDAASEPTLPAVFDAEQSEQMRLPDDDSQSSALSAEMKELRKKVAALEKVNDKLIDKHKSKQIQTRQQAKKVIDEYNALLSEAKRQIKESITPRLAKIMGKRELNSLLAAITDIRSVNALRKATDRITDVATGLTLRYQSGQFEKLLQMKADDPQWLEKFVKTHTISPADAKKLLEDRYRGENARGVSVARMVDDATRVTMEYVRDNIKSVLQTDAEGNSSLAAKRDELETKRALAEQGGGQLGPSDEARLVAVSLLEYYRDNVAALGANIRELVNQRKEAAEKLSDLRQSGADKAVIECQQEGLEAIESELRRNKADYADALSDFNAQIKELLMTGRSNLREFKEQENRERENLVQMVFEGASDKQVERMHVQDSTQWRKFANHLNNLFASHLYSLSFTLKTIDKNAPGGMGELYECVMTGEKGYVTAADNFYGGLRLYIEELNVMAARIFGKEYAKNGAIKLLRETNKKELKGVTLEERTYGKPTEVNLTVGSALYIRALNKQDSGAKSLRSMGISQADVDRITDALYAQAPKMIQFADWVQEEFLPSKREKYNEVHLKVFGTQMREEENYFPIRRRKSDVSRKVDGREEMRERLPSTLTGSIINRVPNNVALDISANFFEVLFEHGQQMEHWAAFTPAIKNMNALLSNTAVRKLLSAGGRRTWERLKTSAEIASGQYLPKTNKLNDTLAVISKALAASKITLRLFTAIKQIASAPAFYGYSADPKFAAILTKHLVNPLAYREAWVWGMKNLPQMHERWHGRLGGDEKLAGNTGEWLESGLKKIVKYGFTPNAFVDAVTCCIGAKAVYEYELKRGSKLYNPEEAERLARTAATISFNETQQSAEGAYLSQLQKDRDLFSVCASMFNNATFGYNRKMIEGIQELRRDPKKEIEYLTKRYIKRGMEPETAAKQARRDVRIAKYTAGVRIGLFGAILQIYWNLFSKAWQYIWGDPEDKDVLQDIKDGALVGPFRGFVWGNVYESVLNGYDFEPVMLVGEVQEFLRDVKNNEENHYVNTANVTALLGLVASGVFGINFETFERMYHGLEGMIRDGMDVEDVMNLTNAPKLQTRLIAGRKREDETLEEYNQRVGFIYRATNRKYDPKRDNAYEQSRRRGAYRRMGIGRSAEQVDERYRKILQECGLAIDGDEKNNAPPEYERLRRRIKGRAGNIYGKSKSAVRIVDEDDYVERLRLLHEKKQEVIRIYEENKL